MSELLINRIEFGEDGQITAIEGNDLPLDAVLGVVWRWREDRRGFGPPELAAKDIDAMSYSVGNGEGVITHLWCVGGKPLIYHEAADNNGSTRTATYETKDSGATWQEQHSPKEDTDEHIRKIVGEYLLSVLSNASL